MTHEMPRVVLVLVVWTALASLYGWFVLVKQRAGLSEQQQRLQRLSQVQSSIEAFTERLDHFVPPAEAKTWVERYTPHLKQAATAAGVTIGDLTPAPAGSLGLSFSISGSFTAIAGLIEELEKGDPNKRVVRVRELELSRGTDAQISGSARLEAYTR